MAGLGKARRGRAGQGSARQGWARRGKVPKGRKETMTPFRGGLPYKPDVERLNEAFPVNVLLEGSTITHERISEILQLKQGSPRYYAVVNSWIRSKHDDNGIFIIWEPKVGLKVLDPALKLDHGRKRVREKAYQLSRATRIVASVDRSRLDSSGQKLLDHTLKTTAVLAAALANAKKELAVDIGPVKSLPKRLPAAG